MIGVLIIIAILILFIVVLLRNKKSVADTIDSIRGVQKVATVQDT